APANEAVDYVNMDFVNPFAHDTIYRGPPTPQLEKAWEELWFYELIILDPASASNLINQTDNFPEHKDAYPISLEVYHQLHCLNALRQSLYPDYYNSSHGNMLKHWNHCVENLRQAILCHSDIAPITFVHDARRNQLLPRDSITATCRNFDSIQKWAAAHQKDF
ncbi:hypothetical protein K505DRAFT_232421, partial [Melanomma pulvis-pyrius CBS 109.77]